jgi:hypothetical protein
MFKNMADKLTSAKAVSFDQAMDLADSVVALP